MSRNARARAAEFSWDKIAAEYEALLLRAESGGERRLLISDY
jgi:glycosyltransferase involved in cell wall biosynthesis